MSTSFTTTSAVEITVTNPNPPHSGFSTDPPSSSQINSPKSRRLLYRGALSLPDSHLLLDGLTFTGNAGGTGSGSGMSLFENPLALALESMRGRPTLRFMGMRKLNAPESRTGESGWVDFSGDICMDIHLNAILSRIYFENLFCLNTISADGRTNLGVRVALGDSSGPETTEILIYGKLVERQPKIQLHVARLTFTPPPASLRLPRPDDPTPRRIPDVFGASSSSKRKASESNITSKKRKLEAGKGKATPPENVNIQRAKEIMLYGSAILSASGPGHVLGRPGSMNNGVFKVPVLPAKGGSSKSKGKSASVDTKDVLGVGYHEDSASVVGLFGSKTKAAKNRWKGKEDGDDGEMDTGSEVGEVEKANRAKIKKHTIKFLASPVIGMNKSNPEFKDLFGHIYRGAAFAARKTINVNALDINMVDRLIEAHALLYVGGYGSRTTA